MLPPHLGHRLLVNPHFVGNTLPNIPLPSKWSYLFNNRLTGVSTALLIKNRTLDETLFNIAFSFVACY
jgi:hypothetical protein